MTHATIIFTRRPWNPISWLIRWAIPVSRFQWARASHSMILDGDHVIHATMTHGVVRVPIAEAMRGQVEVTRRDYEVPDAEAGLAWARQQVGKDYDFKGAIGLSIKPSRQWESDEKWFCHELSAAVLHACGRRIFDSFGHVTDSALLLVNPGMSTHWVKGEVVRFSRGCK